MVTTIKTHLRSSLFVNTYLLVVMRVFGAATGFVYWALAARATASADIGLASGAVSAATFFAGIAQLGLGYGLIRHLPSSDDPNGLLNLSIVLSGIASLVLGLIYLLTLPLWSLALVPLRSSAVSGVIFILLVVSTTITQLLHWAFLAMRRLSLSLWKMSIQSALAIVLLIVLLPFTSGYFAIAMSYMLSTVLALALTFWPFLPNAQPGYRFSLKFKFSMGSSFAHYSYTNYLADQFLRAPDTLLLLIVIARLGTSAGAYFFVVWTLGRSMAAWAGSISESLFAEGANDSAKASTYAWRSVKLGMLLASGLIASTILGGKLLLSIYGQDYVDQGIEPLYLIVLTTIPTVLLSILVSLLRIYDRLRAVSIIMIVSATSGILLSVAMMQWGLTGVATGWLVSQTLVLIGSVIWWRYHSVPEKGGVLASS